MKKLFIGFCMLFTLIGCENERCEYIDGLGIKQICEHYYPNETEYFCHDVGTYISRNMPNRIATKTCYQWLTKSEQNEFWAIFEDGVKYARSRSYLRSHRY